MTFRCLRMSALTGAFSLIAAAQQVQTPAQPPPVAAPEPAPAPAPATPPVNVVPDYPDRRGLEIGLFYWATSGSSQPDIFTGRGATDNETLTQLGDVHQTPGIEASLPITRTGSLHLEVFETKGDGSQTASVATTVYGTAISAGDYLLTQYQIRGAKFYLDDLLYPHKFPVSRLRFKSIWAVEYIGVHTNINAPYVIAGEVADGTNNIILPVFGLAGEYALTKHILFRLDGSGFGLYHRSDIWDANATLSFRVTDHVQLTAGAKALHFKSSPKSTEYVIDTLKGAYIGASWIF